MFEARMGIISRSVMPDGSSCLGSVTEQLLRCGDDGIIGAESAGSDGSGRSNRKSALRNPPSNQKLYLHHK